MNFEDEEVLDLGFDGHSEGLEEDFDSLTEFLSEGEDREDREVGGLLEDDEEELDFGFLSESDGGIEPTDEWGLEESGDEYLEDIGDSPEVFEFSEVEEDDATDEWGLEIDEDESPEDVEESTEVDDEENGGTEPTDEWGFEVDENESLEDSIDESPEFDDDEATDEWGLDTTDDEPVFNDLETRPDWLDGLDTESDGDEVHLDLPESLGGTPEDTEIDWASEYGEEAYEESVVESDEEITFNDGSGYLGTEEDILGEDIETLKNNLIASNFQIEKSAYSLHHEVINIGDIVISSPIMKGRSKTHSGLAASVGEMGVLIPVDVLVMEGYQNWLDTPEDERTVTYVGDKYQLLSGMRRIFAAKKNGLEEIPAQVWTFRNPAYGRELAVLLSCILDKKQRHSWGETWNMLEVLEDQFTELSPSQLEYLLEIEPGDSMKLKDIMGSHIEYPEIAEDLLEGHKTLQQCYQALQKARREIAQWDREDTMGVSSVEEAEGIVEGVGNGEGLSNSAVMDILNMANEDYEVGEEDFGGDYDSLEPAVEQSVDNRHALDPVLRGNVLMRDGYSCQCCKFGEDLNNSLVLPSLTVHHMLPVYLNKMKHPQVRSQDIPENLVTLCNACHSAVHTCSDSRAKLPVKSEEEFLELKDFQQERWKNILKYAKIITKGEEVTGFKRRKGQSKTLPDAKPFWEAGPENEEAIAKAQNAL